MTKHIAAGLALMAGVGASADSPPAVDIANTHVRARLYLPDAVKGFYRGTRFDWSGVIGSLEFAGHNFFPPWFQRVDPAVHDFAYDGDSIVASPCTAVTGPAEEFSTDGKALGFDQAKPGGTFLKIGVGVLRRPDARDYDMFRQYELVDGGTWSISASGGGVEFKQSVSDRSSGYAYEYQKSVFLREGTAQLTIAHSLRNVGSKGIRTSSYNHNFLFLDQQAPGPGVSIKLPFAIRPSPAPDAGVVAVEGNQIRFLKTLAGTDRVYMGISGFSAEAKDYDILIEDRVRKVALRIKGDKPLSRAALWCIRAPISFEPFIEMNLEPGAQFAWEIQYHFQELP